MRTKEELEARKKEIEAEKWEIERELKHLEIPERIRNEVELGHGWPRINQSLGLKKKLDPETYDALYREFHELGEAIARMVPEYADVKKECEICEKVKELVK